MAEKKKSHKDQVAELKELLVRTQANFENYKKQTEKRVQEIREFASQVVILELLPVLDTFDLAIKTSAVASKEDFLQGVELIYNQLNSLLEEKGVQRIKAKGCMFDPYKHEALLKVHSEEPENTILEVIQKGYTLRGKVIRAAKVKMSAGSVLDNKVKTDQLDKADLKCQIDSLDQCDTTAKKSADDVKETVEKNE